jgi:hypothetical protein
MFVYFRHGVSGFPLIVPICFSDLKDFPPKLFNARRYLPFVHRVQNCDPQMHKLPPSGIPTVFAVSNRINDFGKLRANRGAAMDFQTSVAFVFIAALVFPLALRRLTRVRR